tara:strand:+ start:1681 stop:2160 length:480 start_codon:yes stop_codon:yes gene_type:complete
MRDKDDRLIWEGMIDHGKEQYGVRKGVMLVDTVCVAVPHLDEDEDNRFADEDGNELLVGATANKVVEDAEAFEAEMRNVADVQVSHGPQKGQIVKVEYHMPFPDQLRLPTTIYYRVYDWEAIGGDYQTMFNEGDVTEEWLDQYVSFSEVDVSKSNIKDI